MSKTYDVAVVGATGTLGEALLALLAEREFPVGRVYAVDSEPGTGATVPFGHRELPVQAIENFDFGQAPLALFASDAAMSAIYVQRAAAAGCVVIDHSSVFRDEPDVPLVVPEVNPKALAQYRQRGIVASPNAVVVQMLIALKPIDDAAGVERINVCTYESVSGTGRGAVEELGKQTADLLSFRSIEPRIYPKQIAFNVIPQTGVCNENGYTSDEMQIIRETRKVLGNKTLGVNPTSVIVPVFYGHCAAMHIETRQKIDAQQARALLERTPGIEVIDMHSEGGFPTPVSDASGTDAVYVGRIREDLSHPRGLNLWIVADNLRRGAALNSVRIAECLVGDYL